MKNPNSAAPGEADRLLAIASKLLHTRDLVGARDFAILAQEIDPLIEGSDQILAVSEVLISSEKRVNNNYPHDWYSILQIERQSDDIDLIRKQYRRLALLLHPDTNNFPFADQAFKLVADAWEMLSDPVKKSQFDQLLIPFQTEVLDSSSAQGQFSTPNQSQGFQMDFRTSDAHQDQQHVKLPVRRGQSDSRGKQKGSARATNRVSSFWTACPYCYVLYEYPRVYKGYCLKCPSCKRAFHGAEIPALPPQVSGKEAYYCSWAYFPVGVKSSQTQNDGNGFNINVSNISSNPQLVQQNWQTSLPHPQMQAQHSIPQRIHSEMSAGAFSATGGSMRKRGRPRINPL